MSSCKTFVFHIIFKTQNMAYNINPFPLHTTAARADQLSSERGLRLYEVGVDVTGEASAKVYSKFFVYK